MRDSIDQKHCIHMHKWVWVNEFIKKTPVRLKNNRQQLCKEKNRFCKPAGKIVLYAPDHMDAYHMVEENGTLRTFDDALEDKSIVLLY